MGLITVDFKFVAKVETLRGTGEAKGYCSAPRWKSIVDIQEEIEEQIKEKYPDAKIISIDISRV